MSAPLHVVPPTKSASGSAPSVSLSTTANSHGLHDTLRHGGGRSLVNEIKKDDFKTRLEQWDQTQLNLKMQMQRNAYGLGAPLRSMMERQIVSTDAALPQFSSAQFHLDILSGKDESLDVEHFFNGPETSNWENDTFHSQIQRKMKL